MWQLMSPSWENEKNARCRLFAGHPLSAHRGKMAAASPMRRSACPPAAIRFCGASAWRRSIRPARSRISQDMIATWCCCGARIALKFGSGGTRVLRNVGDWLEFDGAAAAHCELLDGPCVDLNLMVSRSLRTAARIERLSEPRMADGQAWRNDFDIRPSGPIVSGCARGNLRAWSLGILLSSMAAARI